MKLEFTTNEISTEKLLETLTELPIEVSKECKRYLEEKLPELEKAESISHLLLRLNIEYCFIDYGLIEHLIEELGSQDLRGKMQSYKEELERFCLLYTSPSPRDATLSRMPSSA